jgi:polyisoprenoid-binding protein YceI
MPLFFSAMSRAPAPAEIPVFKIAEDESAIRFAVKASVALDGTFDKWNATMTFTSTDASTGVLDVKIDADTGPTTFDVPGTFTIRGVSKSETLAFTITGKGTGPGEIKGTMAFDRKDFGMNSGIPFIKIADRVEVSLDLKGKPVSGPPLVFKQ